MYYLIVAILFFQTSCIFSANQTTAEAQQQIQAERKPFQKSSAVLKTPGSYLKREKYDPRPRVVPIDEKAGKYELRWIGYDGKEKIVSYQRSDSIDGTVEARVEKRHEGKFTYKYLIKNLPTSPAYLSGFVVQTLAQDVRDEPFPIVDDIYIGHMGNYIPGFTEGVWRRFAPLGEKLPRIEAGKSIEFSLVSSALPGIVGCRATGGDLTIKGVGEHMPTELESAMPGYEEWAKGYTIGPVDSLSKLSKSERAKYILDNLPLFHEAGWMSAGTAAIYKSILQKEDMEGALKQAQKDLKNEFITGEVFYIIEGLNQ